MKTLIIYSDGACRGNPGPGGWAAVIVKNNSQIVELGGYEQSTTNNAMEIRGILESLDYAVNDRPDKIIVYSDSSYVLNAITKWIYGWQKNGWKSSEGKDVANQNDWKHIYLSIQKLKGTEISWNYVRGHTGVPGNERCDKLSVSFSYGDVMHLYNGLLKNYDLDLTVPPKTEPIPTSSFTKSKNSKDAYYLILKNGQIDRVLTWAECEAKVKGVSGAKFKKVNSSDQESDILKGWGYGN